ncbi:hypothetical protein EVAR_87924_1 [Eumeta japonica]|uniref:Uncharacterized protein n=1 Tax=Eumeta variegata TaxID=151549 RepID=A0A4C1WVE3_EUMVA|nr:hypothetical protein EVAR_87924_1 [Eumeta japonica]
MHVRYKIIFARSQDLQMIITRVLYVENSNATVYPYRRQRAKYCVVTVTLRRGVGDQTVQRADGRGGGRGAAPPAESARRRHRHTPSLLFIEIEYIFDASLSNVRLGRI